MVLAAVVVCVALPAGYAAGDDWHPQCDLWPIFRYWRTDQGAARHVEALWPLIEWHDSPASQELYVRPLYNRRRDKASNRIVSEWLYPLGSGLFRSDLSRRVFYPLALRDREEFTDGKVRTRTIFLPFLYHRSGRGPGDLLIFPFGGVLHNVLGRDKIVIVLWPLFIYQQGKDARAWGVLHPIFNYVKWDDGGRGLKLWPLFGLNRRPGRLFKLFVLWPVGHYQWMKTEYIELRQWGIFPFVGRVEGRIVRTEDRGVSKWSVLWPFFSHMIDRRLGREQWWCPWPFLGRHTGERVSGWTAWPVYARERAPGQTKAQFLWPFGWYRRQESAERESTSLRFVPLMFWEREEAPAEEAGERLRSGAWQLWPLVKWRRTADGGAHLETPSVMPLRWHGGWERHFAPFFRVFEYHRGQDRRRSWRLLWRLVRVDIEPKERHVEVFPLFKIHTSADERAGLRWSFMKGLLGYERAGDRRTWRFLYLIRVGGGASTKGNTEG